MPEQKIEINALDFLKELGRDLHSGKRKVVARLPEEGAGTSLCWWPGLGASLLWAPTAVHTLGPSHVEAEDRVSFPFCSICRRVKRGPIFCYRDDWQAIF